MQHSAVGFRSYRWLEETGGKAVTFGKHMRYRCKHRGCDRRLSQELDGDMGVIGRAVEVGKHFLKSFTFELLYLGIDLAAQFFAEGQVLRVLRRKSALGGRMQMKPAAFHVLAFFLQLQDRGMLTYLLFLFFGEILRKIAISAKIEFADVFEQIRLENPAQVNRLDIDHGFRRKVMFLENLAARMTYNLIALCIADAIVCDDC